jgi:hypothetical protein
MTTTESSAQPHGGAAGKWTTRYEDLRRQVLEEPAGGGWGRSLFVRRGLLDWMEAWPPENDYSPSTSTPTAQVAGETPSLPSTLYREMTRVLVNMILDSSKEVYI